MLHTCCVYIFVQICSDPDRSCDVIFTQNITTQSVTCYIYIQTHWPTHMGCIWGLKGSTHFQLKLEFINEMSFQHHAASALITQENAILLALF